MGLQLAAITALCAMAVPNPAATSKPAVKSWGIAGLVTGSITPGNSESPRASIGTAFAVGGYFNLSETFGVFGSIRADQRLTDSFHSADQSPRRFNLRDLNLGVSATFVEAASQIKLMGWLSADFPTSEASRTVSRVLAPIVGLSAQRAFEDLGPGDLQFRAAAELRSSPGQTGASTLVGPYRGSLRTTEAYSVRTTGTGTYAFENGVSVSVGLAWVKVRRVTPPVSDGPVFAANQVDLWVDTTIVGLELGYEVTDSIGLAAGYSAATDGRHRSSNTQTPQSPHFFTDIYAWSGQRFYLSAAFTY